MNWVEYDKKKNLWNVSVKIIYAIIIYCISGNQYYNFISILIINANNNIYVIII